MKMEAETTNHVVFSANRLAKLKSLKIVKIGECAVHTRVMEGGG